MSDIHNFSSPTLVTSPRVTFSMEEIPEHSTGHSTGHSHGHTPEPPIPSRASSPISLESMNSWPAVDPSLEYSASRSGKKHFLTSLRKIEQAFYGPQHERRRLKALQLANKHFTPPLISKFGAMRYTSGIEGTNHFANVVRLVDDLVEGEYLTVSLNGVIQQGYRVKPNLLDKVTNILASYTTIYRWWYKQVGLYNPDILDITQWGTGGPLAIYSQNDFELLTTQYREQVEIYLSVIWNGFIQYQTFALQAPNEGRNSSEVASQMGILDSDKEYFPLQPVEPITYTYHRNSTAPDLKQDISRNDSSIEVPRNTTKVDEDHFLHVQIERPRMSLMR